jgi:hypothetical protein
LKDLQKNILFGNDDDDDENEKLDRLYLEKAKKAYI